jgi:S-adenosylmethionine:tRNA ribosyltransferase-isomerase
VKLKDFDYNLPRELIAQEPIKPRDYSRLLVLGRASGRIEHKKFFEIGQYLKSGDVLVFNDSKVFPARLLGRKEVGGGKIEVFLHFRRQNEEKEVWQCLVGGKKPRRGMRIEFYNNRDKAFTGELIQDNQDGTWEVEFDRTGKKFMDAVYQAGLMPLPPYIKRDGKEPRDSIDYQTVYARDDKVGSVAAPTAGFHFTPKLMDKLAGQGVQFEYVTLHVGLGTFSPVKSEDITEHKMHAEYAQADAATLERIYAAKAEGRRIISVGTTATRTMEAIARKFSQAEEAGDFQEFVDIFIYPGYEFKLIDGMVTNFHLPKSTLLMLVSAFASLEPSRKDGKQNIDKAYQEAIREKYRFYSYGDAMLII